MAHAPRLTQTALALVVATRPLQVIQSGAMLTLDNRSIMWMKYKMVRHRRLVSPSSAGARWNWRQPRSPIVFVAQTISCSVIGDLGPCSRRNRRKPGPPLDWPQQRRVFQGVEFESSVAGPAYNQAT